MTKTFSFIVNVKIDEDDPLNDCHDDIAKDQLKHFIVDALSDADNLMEYTCEAM